MSIDLSIVTTTRNDDHGTHLLERMQLFVDSVFSIARCGQNVIELIIIEWNPPVDTQPVHEALLWHHKPTGCSVRVITVPQTVHNTIEHADKITLFQYIAKNVGIRRAQGAFVLVANCDVLFSPELIDFLASAKFEANCFYRINRTDVDRTVLHDKYSFEEIVTLCSQNIIRVHRPANTKDGALHTSACGDFILMAKDTWFTCRGYPELGLNDLYIDGLVLHMAKALGLHQVILQPLLQLFHIDHAASFTEHAARLARCPNLDYEKEYRPWCQCMLTEQRIITPNTTTWGYAHEHFKEITIAAPAVSVQS